MPFIDRLVRPSPVLALILLVQGCASFLGQTRDPDYDGRGPGALSLPPILGYQDTSGPLSYRAQVIGSGADHEVRGEACQSAVMLPLGLIWAAVKSGSPARAPAFVGASWGEGGYATAVSRALAQTPGSRLVNVRADLNTRIILGVWRQECVRVTAQAVPAR